MILSKSLKQAFKLQNSVLAQPLWKNSILYGFHKSANYLEGMRASGGGGWFVEGRSEDALPSVGTLGPGARCCNLPCLAYDYEHNPTWQQTHHSIQPHGCLRVMKCYWLDIFVKNRSVELWTPAINATLNVCWPAHLVVKTKQDKQKRSPMLADRGLSLTSWLQLVK